MQAAADLDSRSSWMQALAGQFATARRRHPEDDLMIVFDIDGTILDMRHMVHRVLIGYDRAHGTGHFVHLAPSDIEVHENHVDRFLADIPLPASERRRIHDWYLDHRWSSEAVLASHRPYRGVLEVIRWFMLQPRTHVGLNTGRPEALREDTLRSLNALGREYRVAFDGGLLEMNPEGWERRVADNKAAALRRLRERGYRIFAVVDNEPDNIERMLEADDEGEILFLHADTIFVSKARRTPRTVSGGTYSLAGLMSEGDIPDRVTLVWHGINDPGNFRQFLGSPVQWGECDVRRDPLGRLVLRHDSFERTPWRRGERCPGLGGPIDEIGRRGKSLKLDLKEGGQVVERVLEHVALYGLDDARLWFNGNIEILGEAGFRAIAAAHPGAVVQCPVDFLAPLVGAAPAEAQRILARLRSWGINRFSVGWRRDDRRVLLDRMEEWGCEVNLYDVPDLEAFLQATLLLPRSLTADFNFPAWQYYGRGSGEGSAFHDYRLRPAAERPGSRAALSERFDNSGNRRIEGV